jgi:hypothetical protein
MCGNEGAVHPTAEQPAAEEFVGLCQPHECLGDEFICVDNEGKGDCLYAAIRDAILLDEFKISTEWRELYGAFLEYRTPTGRATDVQYVRGLREAAAAQASSEEMHRALDLYKMCISQQQVQAGAKKRVAALKRKLVRGTNTKSLLDSEEAQLRCAVAEAEAEAKGGMGSDLLAQFEHMGRVARLENELLKKGVVPGVLAQQMLAVYRAQLGSMRKRVWGDEGALAKLEVALNVNILVISSDHPAGVQRGEVGGARSGGKWNIVVEHVVCDDGLGHYRLVGRKAEAMSRYFESRASSPPGTQTLFTVDELPDSLQKGMYRPHEQSAALVSAMGGLTLAQT